MAKLVGFSGKRWLQYKDEIDPFIRLLIDEGCTSYLEIGCCYGDNLHAVGMALPEGSKIVGVDYPGAYRGISNGYKKWRDSGQYLKRAAADLLANGRNARIILGDSHEAGVIQAVAALGPFDAVFIDGDHSSKGVRQDWEAYGKLGRIVAFHDIAGDTWNAKNIKPTWWDARDGRKWKEIVAEPNNRGIGVIWI